MLNYQANLDLAFQALADPARRAMMDRLAAGPASVSELAKPLPMSLPAVMLHLKVLEESGLVKSEKAGRVRSDGRVYLAETPAQILVFVAGGNGGLHAHGIHNMGTCMTTTKPIAG